MIDVKRWKTLNNSRHQVVHTAWLCRSTIEFASGILLDQKFLYRCVHAAFVNTKCSENWSELTLFMDRLSTISGFRACSRRCQANLVTVITQDIPPLVKTPPPVGWSSRVTSGRAATAVACCTCSDEFFHSCPVRIVAVNLVALCVFHWLVVLSPVT